MALEGAPLCFAFLLSCSYLLCSTLFCYAMQCNGTRSVHCSVFLPSLHSPFPCSHCMYEHPESQTTLTSDRAVQGLQQRGALPDGVPDLCSRGGHVLV